MMMMMMMMMMPFATVCGLAEGWVEALSTTRPHPGKLTFPFYFLPLSYLMSYEHYQPFASRSKIS